MLPRYVMFVTSIWVNWNILLLEWSLMTLVTVTGNPGVTVRDPYPTCRNPLVL